MTKNRVKELSYTLFFILMIFAKGIGLDSGNRMYYVLSMAACLCVGIKLILTKYKMHEIAVMALLCSLAFIAYRNSGRLGIVLSVLTIIGIKDMDVRRLFRLGTVVYGGSFACTVIAAKLGLIGNPLVVHEKAGEELIRWGMGYSTGNVFHVSYFMLTVLLCYSWGKRYCWRHMLILMVGNGLAYLYSLSYTGVLVTAFYLFLNLYAVNRKRLGRAERIVCQLPLPLCLLFSFGVPFLLQNPAVQKLDQLLQARLTFSAYYLQNQPITLFGTRMRDVPYFWVIMDNGYVYFLMTFGAAAFALFCIGYAVVIGRFSHVGRCFSGREKAGNGGNGELDKKETDRKKPDRKEMGEKEPDRKEPEDRLPELAMIFAFLLYGIMEQFISNAFMNFSLLFFGEILFGGKARGEDERQHAAEACAADFAWRQRFSLTAVPARDSASAGTVSESGFGKKETGGNAKERYVRAVVCGMAGIVVLAWYLAAVPVKDYIGVPVGALNSVEAQSIQISTENPEGTKKGLKKAMETYAGMMENPVLLQEAIRKAGMEGRLSAEEAAAALEYSLPVYVQDSENYDIFRVRLLELYYDISEEEYFNLMEQIVALTQEQTGNYFPKGGIYGESIGKSFGDDRIEHMSKEKEYVVEKSGTIAETEHFRDGVFCGVTVGGAMYLFLFLVWHDRKKWLPAP